MFDWIFAFFHLFLLIGIVVYAVISLVQGNILRFAVIALLLGLYYLLVLHKSLKKEIERRRKKSE